MKEADFYNSIGYKEGQAEITRKNWQNGIYDFLRKQEKRRCANSKCGKWFEVKPADTKRFCSRKCAAQVNNPKRAPQRKGIYRKKESIRSIKCYCN